MKLIIVCGVIVYMLMGFMIYVVYFVCNTNKGENKAKNKEYEWKEDMSRIMRKPAILISEKQKRIPAVW